MQTPSMTMVADMPIPSRSAYLPTKKPGAKRTVTNHHLKSALLSFGRCIGTNLGEKSIVAEKLVAAQKPNSSVPWSRRYCHPD